MRSKALVSSAVVLLATAWCWPSHANACTGAPSCTPPWVAPEGGEVESSRLSFTYYSGERALDGGVVMPRITRTRDGGVEDVPYEAVLDGGRWQLTPRELQPVGTTLVLEADKPSYCYEQEVLRGEYRVVATQPPPDLLGTMLVGIQNGPLPLGVNAGATCWANRDVAYAGLSAQLDPSAAPFASRFVYSLYVDGKKREPYLGFRNQNDKPWSLNPKGARIYAYCGDDPGSDLLGHVGSGKHTVRIEATLDALTLSTPEVELDLHCDVSLVDAGAPLQPNAGRAMMDAGEGDGCSLAASRGLGGVWLTLALMLRAIWRRRKREPICGR